MQRRPKKFLPGACNSTPEVGHRYGFDWIEQECTGTNDFYAALALRPYIGQFDGWDQGAYDALRRSFEHYRGELLHPEDAPLPGITYEKSINGIQSNSTRPSGVE
ncbi:hypothetical protein [Mycolicibacterium aubagnense]|uniref:Uncharacterized protein n=1 Tax=Mycolicibacterium aubagnense TaxID=319707 RepID=A0ABN5YKJ4_9MYCO|nr:hypothetical protein [Mycolicibacterium aubagnense]TLH64454.1 hypothetical protein C1S80_12275 [Mycolicibacterium aubagnense]BBX82187.1 hypothetical protein MAUB_00600 [Mycolicibacterium aubagnense]